MADDGSLITGITNGTLYQNDGTTPITSGTFITFVGNAGLKFTPTANFNGSGSFTIQASTSNGDAGLGGSTVVATITVNAVSDAAPVLDNTKSPALTAMNEDAGAPSGAVGTLVSAVVDFAIPSGQVDNVTDVDSGGMLGIAVTAADTANGAWWYSTNNGASWNALGAVASNNAQAAGGGCQHAALLPARCQLLRHVGHRDYLPHWDQTSGSNGTLADTTSNGGTTAFSTATDTASLTVNAVNDAPVLDNTKSPTLTPINEDAGALEPARGHADLESGGLRCTRGPGG